MKSRFLRQERLSEVGQDGQRAIENSKILIVGMGGLGCPSAQYLVAAGVGCIGIMDGDRVDETNLHRQILYSYEDIGMAKVEIAEKRLQSMNPKAKINCYFEYLSSRNANSILKNYDIVLDCTDNFEVKYLLNDICLQMEKVLISASATGFEANLIVVDGKGPCLRCLYPHSNFTEIGNCNSIGILGAFVGVVGAWQAAETLKIILIQTKKNQNLFVPKGRVLFFDFYTSQVRSVSLDKKSNCFCSNKKNNQNQIEIDSLYLTVDQCYAIKEYVLVDVRSIEERMDEPLLGFESMESIHRPHLDIVTSPFDPKIWDSSKKYVLCCSLGKRSAVTARWLRDHGVHEAYSIRRA